MNFDQPYGADMPELESNRKKGKNNFLKMFRFDKARTPKNGGQAGIQDDMSQNSLVDQSVDYANYLFEI